MTDPHDRPIDATAGPDKTQEAHDTPEITALSAGPRQSFTIRERIALTYEYHGGWSLVLRVLTFPLRFTPLKRFLDRRPSTGKARRLAARRWYRELRQARDDRDPELPGRRQTSPRWSRASATHDRQQAGAHRRRRRRAAAPSMSPRCGESTGSRWSRRENAGFAANVNRGIRAAAAIDDVVVLNSDMIADAAGSRACSTPRARAGRRRHRRRQAALPRRPDPVRRHRSQPRRPGVVRPPLPLPAGRLGPGQRSRAGARGHRRVHVHHARADRSGRPASTRRYPMAYEDVDLCLRAWQAGFRVVYWPAAVLDHLESVTRGTEVGERERASQRVFWERWGDFFDARDVRTADGALRVVYVTEDTGVGGGHRDIFEHLNGLLRARARGRAVDARRSAGLVRAPGAGAHVRGLRRTGRGAGAGGGDQDRHLVEHRGAGLAGERACAASRCTSSRTSRPATTRRRAHAPGRRAGLLPATSFAT